MSINKRTIIRNIGAYEDYPFESLSIEVFTLFKNLTIEAAAYQRKYIMPLLRALECFLQITNQKLVMRDFSRPEFNETFLLFIGALHSEKFYEGTYTPRYKMARTFTDILILLKKKLPALSLPVLTLTYKTISMEVQSCVILFEKTPLNEEKVWLWTGWRSVNRNKMTISLPLYPVYRRLGRSFAQQFFLECDGYFSSRKNNNMFCLKSFSQFIGNYPRTISPSDFQDNGFIDKFWREFLAFFLTTNFSNGNGMSIESLSSLWQNQFIPFVKEHLIPSGLFAEPYGSLPSIPTNDRGSRTNVITTEEGHEVKTKLLTHIPLHVTDEDAIHLLFEQIQVDFDYFVDWAKWAVNDIWVRHQNSLALAPTGKAVHVLDGNACSAAQRWQIDRSNPEHLANAAATLKLHGFYTGNDSTLQLLYPTPLDQTAYELALPVTNALLPHCVLLVANHPTITPSFLEKLELFDKNGDQAGFVQTDSGYKLISHKDRRGSKLAQQIISLNEDTANVVHQIIALTNPLRKYLKNKNDDDWRYLFLSCKVGFGYPIRITRLCNATCLPIRMEALALSMEATCQLGLDERRDLVKRFSLPALRASAGVLVYLKTQTVGKMAKALGHARYDHRLISHYLPAPLLDFFEERWIRIHQTAIIVEVLKDSKYLLKASGFKSMSLLHEFLNNHALKSIPKHLIDPNPDAILQPSSNKKEVVFSVNTAILTILISLQLAVEKSPKQVCAKAYYWAAISKRVVAYIESELSGRVDLQAYLEAARRKADPKTMEALIYAA